MAVYDRNYELLSRLLPDFDTGEGVLTAGAVGKPDLYLRLEEKSRYTTTIHLTHLLDVDGETVADPDILVRIYHDAHQAEVMSCRVTGFMPMDAERSESSTVLDCKSESNIFLMKWLQYMVAAGYRFDTDNNDRVNE